MSRIRRNLLLIIGIAVVYYLVILFTWALQPLEDSVPIGQNEAGKLISQPVECNTLFAATAHTGSFPLVSPPNQYQRVPCVLVHDDAQRIFALNTALVAALVGGIAFVLVRRPVKRELVAEFS